MTECCLSDERAILFATVGADGIYFLIVQIKIVECEQRRKESFEVGLIIYGESKRSVPSGG